MGSRPDLRLRPVNSHSAPESCTLSPSDVRSLSGEEPEDRGVKDGSRVSPAEGA